MNNYIKSEYKKFEYPVENTVKFLNGTLNTKSCIVQEFTLEEIKSANILNENKPILTSVNEAMLGIGYNWDNIMKFNYFEPQLFIVKDKPFFRRDIIGRINIFDFSDCYFMDTDNHEYKASQSLLISLAKELKTSKNSDFTVDTYNKYVLKITLELLKIKRK